MPSQPIHKTIKISKPKNAREGEPFELTWSMIERLTNAAVSAYGREITVFSQIHENQTYDDLANALAIILQCHTFSPGFFEKKNMEWVRVRWRANAEWSKLRRVRMNIAGRFVGWTGVTINAAVGVWTLRLLKKIEEAFSLLSLHPGLFRTYPNPMRSDGVFIGQDKPIKPYNGIFDMCGNSRYPTTPQDAYVLPHQVSHEIAEELLKRLNHAMEILTSENVNRVFMDSLFRSEEDTSNIVIAEGILSEFRFHRERLAAHASEIKAMLACLSEEFHSATGGGWSFLNACTTKDGKLWGQHVNVDQLLALGLASNQAQYLLPRDMWSALPGGMPYFVVLS